MKKTSRLLHNALKKPTALLLTAAVLLSSIVLSPPQYVDAATYYVNFINNITKREESATTLLEGETIYTKKNVPNGYNYQPTPFIAMDTADGPIDTTSTAQGDGIIAKKDLTSVSTSGRVIYNIRPQFSASLTKSDTGIIKSNTTAPSLGVPPVFENFSHTAEITNGKSVSITQNSTLTLTVTSATVEYEKDADGKDTTTIKGQKSLGFGPVVATGDLLGDYNGKSAVWSGKDNNGKYKITITGEGSQAIDLLLTTSSTLPVMYAGSTFTISFSLQTIDPMQLTIISKKHALNEIATAINTPTNLQNFVKLAGGDDQHSITNNFNLLTSYDDFNYKGFKIEWKWVPTNPVHENFVEINPPKPGSTTQVVTITPQLENISGTLEAKVIFNKTGESEVQSTTIAKIPITVLGTGTKPKFDPKFSYTGRDTGAPITDVPPKMDVNDGTHAGFETYQGPFRFTGVINYGSGTQRAKSAKIKVHYNQNGKANIYVGRSTTPYTSGTVIENPSSDLSSEGTLDFELVATHAGRVTIEFIFINTNGTEFAQKTYNIEVVDNSPSKDSSLKELTLYGNVVQKSELVGDNDDSNGTNDEDIDKQKATYLERFNQLYKVSDGKDGIIPFGFKPDILKYDITLPFAVAEVDVKPIFTSIDAKNITVIHGADSYILDGKGERYSDKNSNRFIPLPSNGDKVQIFFTGTAQDGSISSYELAITRAPQSSVASLESLTVQTAKDNVNQALTPAFAPDIYQYDLTLPYAHHTNKNVSDGTPDAVDEPYGALVTAVSIGDWGEKPEFSSQVLKTRGFFASLFSNKNTAEMKLQYKVTQDGEIENVNEITITVRSEDRKQKVTYTLRVTITEPSENNQIADLKVLETDAVTEIPYVGGQSFNKVGRDFYVDIPFKTQKLWFSILPDDDKIQNVKMIYPEIYRPSSIFGDPTEEVVKKYLKKGDPIKISADVKYDPNEHDKTSEFIFEFEAQAENDHWTSDDSETYKLHVNRLSANKDSRLEKLDIVDISTSTPLDEFSFNKVKYNYEVNVPYDTEEVLVTPVASSVLSEVTVNGTAIKDGRLNKNIPLVAGTFTDIKVVVVPESGVADQSTYTVRVHRKAPGTEARLIKLEVGGGEQMLPDPFVPRTLDYSVSIPKGTTSFTITATPYDKNSSITIDGKVAENGKPFGPIFSLDPTTKYTITVTAQDGKTQIKYTLTVTDYNLINKSDKADLLDLKINYGDLKPRFQTGVDNYQIFLKPDAKKLELMPTVSPKAKVTVLVGSKELSPYSGKYATSVLSNKETITIKVTPESENEAFTKTYTFSVIKNDKKEQGAFKPITSDMVDYEKTDPIVIDITNYAVIDATVFNKLKTDYPDKTIVFSGNDYMLKIKGSDIKELVPHTTQFDLAMSLTSPEQSIVSQILSASGNQWDWELEPVYLYFDDHGALPGQMLLTISLGREYQNSPLFWNYLNVERDRIDYYGYINSNSKGTITVPVTHLSTYMVTPRPVYNSEDKTNMGFGWIQNATGGSATLGGGTTGNGNVTDGKDVPKTGTGKEFQ